jgi:hypothetical protein
MENIKIPKISNFDILRYMYHQTNRDLIYSQNVKLKKFQLLIT